MSTQIPTLAEMSIKCIKKRLFDVGVARSYNELPLKYNLLVKIYKYEIAVGVDNDFDLSPPFARRASVSTSFSSNE